MIALYAITDQPVSLPEPGSLHVVCSGDLAAWCGPVVDVEMTAEALWRHERVVEALMDDRDVLPVRFGTHLPDDDAALRALEDNRERFISSLEAVRGAVEIAVRVFSSGPAATVDPDVTEPQSGTAYLRARARVVGDETAARRIVHASLAPEARAATVADGHRAGELMRAAYLVPRTAVESFSARVRALQDENPRLRITCTGPWPPYSFVQS